MNHQPMPADIECERAILGGIMLDPDKLDDVSRLLNAEDFYRPDHGELYTLFRRMRMKGDHIDLVSVPERVARGGNDQKYGGLGYVLELPEAVPATTNLAHYAEVIAEKALRRRAIKANLAAHSALYNESEPVSKTMGDLQESMEVGSGGGGWVQIGEAHAERCDRIERDRASGLEPLIPRSEAIRSILPSLSGGQYLALAARPAMGKSALALDEFAIPFAEAGWGAGIFSIEMNDGELGGRAIQTRTGVTDNDIRLGRADQHAWGRILDAQEDLRKLPLYIDDSGTLTLADVRSGVRRLKRMLAQKGIKLGLVVIDYLQLMQYDPKLTPNVGIGRNSNGLKQIARDEGVVMLILSQLNRGCENRDDKRPMVADLRASGDIEQDADIIAFLYRGEVYDPDDDPGVAEFIVRKHRGGTIGTAKIGFDGPRVRFYDLDVSLDGAGTAPANQYTSGGVLIGDNDDPYADLDATGLAAVDNILEAATLAEAEQMANRCRHFSMEQAAAVVESWRSLNKNKTDLNTEHPTWEDVRQ